MKTGPRKGLFFCAKGKGIEDEFSRIRIKRAQVWQNVDNGKGGTEMAEEMRLAVQRAERQAGVLMETARRHAKKTEETARENAKKAADEGRKQAREEAEALQKKAEAEAAAYTKRQQAHTAKAVEALRQSLMQNEEEAVRIVVGALLSELGRGGE